MTQNKKSIIIVSSEFPPQPGGIGNHAYNLAKHLAAVGYLVTVLVDNRSITGFEESKFDANQAFSIKRITVNRWRALMYLKRLFLFYRLCRNHSYLLASGKFSLWLVGLNKWFHDKKSLAIIHGTEVNLKSRVLKKAITSALRKFDIIVAVSEYTKELVSGIKDIQVIPNGYDADVWRIKLDANSAIEGCPKLVTVGRISERKGQARVIRHLPFVLKQYPKAHYHCVGIHTEKDYYLELIKSLNVESNVTFHGALPQEQLVDLVQQCDIKVMLSSQTNSGDVEGFGIAIIEANAMGIPAIGGFGSGVEDAIDHKKSGLLINANDKIFLDAITTILENKETFKEGALNWADNHKWDKIIKRYIQIIETL